MKPVSGHFPSTEIVEEIFKLISNNPTLTTKDLYDHYGGDKELVRVAITRLNQQGRIKRVRGFHPDRQYVQFFYRICKKPVPWSARMVRNFQT